MKNKLLLFALILMLPLASRGQATFVLDGTPDDSVVFDFVPGDSLTRHSSSGRRSFIDTTGCHLWQIGGTVKSSFLDGGNAVRGIMTDTLASYPLGQDDYFVLRGNAFEVANTILTFEHRYETMGSKDGGFVELSNDSGSTWQDVFQFGAMMEGFYTAQDTITGGIPAFSGSSNGYVRSRLQLFVAIPLKGAQWGTGPVWVRFRFKSDSTADILAGWNIRRITLENDLYLGVENTNLPARLSFSPNPTTGLIHLGDDFPLSPEQRYAVRDVMGRVLAEGKLERTIDLSGLPKGLYFVQVQGKEGAATGRATLL